MTLLYNLQLHEPGQWGKSQKAEQQQLELDLATLPHGDASTFQDFKVHLDSLGYKAPSFGISLGPVLGPLTLNPYQDACQHRFYLTSDGSVYRDQDYCQYVTDDDIKVQHYAECTAAAMAAAAAADRAGPARAKLPVLKVSAMRGNDPLPLKVSAKTLTGKTIAMTAHEATPVGELKLMIQQLEDIPYDQQRLILNGFQCEDDRTLGELAAGSNTPLDSFQPTFSLIPRLRGGMYHATSGRQDNEILIDGGHSFAKVTVLTATGAALELSVPTACGPGGRDFGLEQLAALARKALEQQA